MGIFRVINMSGNVAGPDWPTYNGTGAWQSAANNEGSRFSTVDDFNGNPSRNQILWTWCYQTGSTQVALWLSSSPNSFTNDGIYNVTGLVRRPNIAVGRIRSDSQTYPDVVVAPELGLAGSGVALLALHPGTNTPGYGNAGQLDYFVPPPPPNESDASYGSWKGGYYSFKAVAIGKVDSTMSTGQIVTFEKNGTTTTTLRVTDPLSRDATDHWSTDRASNNSLFTDVYAIQAFDTTRYGGRMLVLTPDDGGALKSVNMTGTTLAITNSRTGLGQPRELIVVPDGLGFIPTGAKTWSLY